MPTRPDPCDAEKSFPYHVYLGDFFVPYQWAWWVPVDPNRGVQNRDYMLKSKLVFEDIKSSKNIVSYFEKSGDPVVVANSHYARGAYWLTWDANLSMNVGKMMDRLSWDKFDDYLSGKFTNISGRRNDVPFPALTAWYLPGLDHDAHDNGMDGYCDFFMSSTDALIDKVTDKLIALDELNNKIFIVVSDHGHTPQATSLPPVVMGGKIYPATTHDKYRDKFKKNEEIIGELYNNNLHLWELAHVVNLSNEYDFTDYVLLCPEKICEFYENIETDDTATNNGIIDNAHEANIIATLNGPMAHIYLKGKSSNGNYGWKYYPDIQELGRLANFFFNLFKDNCINLNNNSLRMSMRRNHKKLINSIDRVLIRIGGVYYVFNGINESGSMMLQMVSDATFNPDHFVKAKMRIDGLNNMQRSGDIVLIMRDRLEEKPEERSLLSG